MSAGALLAPPRQGAKAMAVSRRPLTARAEVCGGPDTWARRKCGLLSEGSGTPLDLLQTRARCTKRRTNNQLGEKENDHVPHDEAICNDCTCGRLRWLQSDRSGY